MPHARTVLAVLLCAWCARPALAGPAPEPDGWLSVEAAPAVAPEPGATRTVAVRITNPTTGPADLLLRCETPPGWEISPRHTRIRLGPGDQAVWSFRATAPALGPHRPVLHVRAEQADAPPGSAPLARLPVPAEADLPRPAADAPNGFLRLNGASAVRVPTTEHPDHFTLEAWVRGPTPSGRRALLSNAESSGFALFWSDGDASARQPSAFVHAGDGYARLAADRPWNFARWTHVALTYDGAHARLFIAGRLADQAPATGPVTPNDLPLYIGADTDAAGAPLSFWAGDIDEVRLSRVVRYEGDFTPRRRLRADADTVLLFTFDEDFGPVFRDASANARHAWAVGRPRTVPDGD